MKNVLIITLVVLAVGCGQNTPVQENESATPRMSQQLGADTILSVPGLEITFNGFSYGGLRSQTNEGRGLEIFSPFAVNLRGSVVTTNCDIDLGIGNKYKINGHDLTASDLGGMRWRGVKDAPPPDPRNGDMYKNRSSGKKYVYDSESASWIE